MLMEPLTITPAVVSTLVMDPVTIIGHAPLALAAIFVISAVLSSIALVVIASLLTVAGQTVRGFLTRDEEAELIVQPKPIVTVHSTPGEAYIPCYFEEERIPEYRQAEEVARQVYAPEATA